MARGRTHDKINLFLGALATGTLLGWGLSPLNALLFALGGLTATFILSPDLDLGPKRRHSWLAPFLYPYSLLFRHRGASHGFMVGTLTRLLYLLCLSAGLIYILHRMGHLQFGPGHYGQGLYDFLINYNPEERPYQLLTWFLIGLYLADLGHVFVDRFTSFFKKIL